MKEEAKQEYEVVRKNTGNYKVGQRVMLTDRQAKKLVNKVALIKKPVVVESENDLGRQNPFGDN